MRRYSPPYHSPPRRGYGGRGRSPPRRGYGGRNEPNNGSLLVRNVPMNCRPEDLRVPFERFGPVRDVYLPKDYYTGEITVVVAAETRKRPEEMRSRGRPRGSSGYGGRRSSYYGRSRSRSISHSRSPRYPSASRSRYRSRSFSPAPRRRDDYSVSPRERNADRSRSPRDHLQEQDGVHMHQRSYSPEYSNADRPRADNGYVEKPTYESEKERRDWRSPGLASRLPSGSRSRSADLSPRHSR